MPRVRKPNLSGAEMAVKTPFLHDIVFKHGAKSLHTFPDELLEQLRSYRKEFPNKRFPWARKFPGSSSVAFDHDRPLIWVEPRSLRRLDVAMYRYGDVGDFVIVKDANLCGDRVWNNGQPAFITPSSGGYGVVQYAQKPWIVSHYCASTSCNHSIQLIWRLKGAPGEANNTSHQNTGETENDHESLNAGVEAPCGYGNIESGSEEDDADITITSERCKRPFGSSGIAESTDVKREGVDMSLGDCQVQPLALTDKVQHDHGGWPRMQSSSISRTQHHGHDQNCSRPDDHSLVRSDTAISEQYTSDLRLRQSIHEPRASPEASARVGTNNMGKIVFLFKTQVGDTNPRQRLLSSCQSATQLFAHARAADIANKTTSTLRIQINNESTRVIVCGDDEDYENLHANLQKFAAGKDVYVSVMPDE